MPDPADERTRSTRPDEQTDGEEQVEVSGSPAGTSRPQGGVPFHTEDRLLHTGGERPVDPEDLVRASGREPTPELVEEARRALEEEGPSAVERFLP